MKPILVLQHAHYDWPAYFTDCLINWEIPFETINIAAGDVLPFTITDYSGFAVMGGGMSSNDELNYPHLTHALNLIKEAVHYRIPVIGHCLGGQLLAKALGGIVIPAPYHEVGWHTIAPLHTATAYEWFGGLAPVTLFEWHNETYLPPANAQLLASSLYCTNQAFVYDNIHLGMQFHVEALPEKINHWLDTAREDVALANEANVHSEERIRRENWVYAEHSQAVARQLYTRWLSNVSRY
ncbi:GMP synthase-like glutamine amidotransferase [Hydromonas duriensis]|uniref:GMP synthase-like glutamine amidotransferase n=2 Tax=Hydromonas duriensis TaxID=1527608 RepID=A0A4R6Y520_9BURK|nr:GMP synthase-like glutamine amidotransferase [Hydromonas duriensis]